MKEEIINELKDSHHSKIRFAVSDIDGVLRGKIILKEKLWESLAGGIGFCDVIFGWDINDACYTNTQFTGWHTGFPDKFAHIDFDTFREIPWENNIPFFLADFFPDSELIPCPRSVLRKVLSRADEMGYKTRFAQEFEWFNFLDTSKSLQSKGFQNLETISTGMFGYSLIRPASYHAYYDDLFNLLDRFKVQLEGLHTETGPGVYEAAIRHKPVLEAADRAILFKTSVREIAGRHGIIPSFMAKWNAGLPGCSGHIHQSLWSEDEKTNLFFNPETEDGLSDLMKSYIAGQLYCLPEILPMYAPTINSYKRLIEGSWAPVTITWGVENRTTALRVIRGNEKGTRLETRVPGADTNPYLAMAAALASGLYGIKHNLPLNMSPVAGNAYAHSGSRRLAANLREATLQMKKSAIAKELFGEMFVEHFCQTREWEWEQYSRQVTDWELKRYFEIV